MKCYLLFLFFSLGVCRIGFAADEAKPEVKKTTVQNVGGLLFEMDEGVKVQKGGGGSVYVKSNSEFMQEKFLSIEERFAKLEERVKKLESSVNGAQNDEGYVPPDPDTTIGKTKLGTRIFST